VARILIISLSEVSSDPRVARQVEALREDEHELIVAAYGPFEASEVAFWRLTSAAPQPLPRTALRMGINATLRLLRQFDRAYWLDRRFSLWRCQLRSVEAELVLVNDAILLPVAFAAADGAPVVFDAHEYAPTQREELFWRAMIGPLTRYICRTYLPKVQGIMVVSEGIGQLYRAYTPVEPVLVTNAPAFASISPRPVGESVKLIHFGGADRQRRLEDLIEVMRHLDERFSLELLLVGNERYVRKLKRLAQDDPRIHFQPPVPMQNLVEVASASDIGIFLHGGSNPQRRYTLPNKLFEFIQARLAIAIGPSPEMAKIVDRYDCGIVSPTFEPRDLAALINVTNTKQLWRYKQNSDLAAKELNAERNAPIIRGVVRRALEAPPERTSSR
jgi:glycosyl transferase family 1